MNISTTDHPVGVTGKIYSVSVKDFITYDEVTFYPGENLNVILGPNGTGKSTLVAAIIIGMGGNCKLLSRSGDLTDFIKNGKDKFELEIQLFKDENRNRIKLFRSYSHEKKQIWLIDGETVNQKDFIQAIKVFNIQIDNLCQFLPQDRVQDFAKMNPQEVLMNTQKSVCGDNMLERFEKLMEYQDSLKNSGKSLENDMRKMLEMENRRVKYEECVAKLKERNEMIHSLDICKMKKAWVQFEKLYLECKEIEKDLKNSLTLLKTNEMELKPYEDQEKKFKAVQQRIEHTLESSNEMTTRLSNNLKDFEVRFEKLEDEINRGKSHLNSVMRSANEHQREVKQAETLLNVLIQDLEHARQDLGDENQIKEQIANGRKNSEELRYAIGEVNRIRDSINVQLENELMPQITASKRRIDNFESIPNQKMKMISAKYPDTAKAILWLRNNQDQFQGRIYEPALMEINVHDKKYAKYLESSVNNRDLTCFICENNQDSSKLMNILREELGLRQTNVASNSRTEIYPPNVPLNDIRRYGFEAYLIDVLDGPAPVLNQLCRLYNIHNIPIGNDRTYTMSDKIPSNINVFFSTNHRFRSSVSAYSKSSSIAVDEITDRGIMNITIDQKAMQTEKKKLAQMTRESDMLKNKRNDLEAKITTITTKWDQMKAITSDLEKKLSIIPQFKDKISRQELKVNRLKNQSSDIESEKRKFHGLATTIIKKMLKLEQEHVLCVKKYNTALSDRERTRLELHFYNRTKSDVKNKINELRQKITDSKRIVNNIENNLTHKKEICKRKQTEAKSLTKGQTPSNPERFEYKKDFDKLPADIEELENHMDEIQSRIDCMVVSDNFQMSDYENLKKAIEQLGTKITSFNQNNEKLEEEMLLLHGQWYPELDHIVQIINHNFSHFMSSMNYAGEVQINCDSVHDYKSYGINILVKYRNHEKMQTLDRFIQSGGERAVAIAIYTLSLQHISHVPFRCVDEINQGMDAQNERRIFEMLVRETCVEGRSQYFFVTPKLLPNLVFNDLMCCHVVYNGFGVKNDLKFVG